MTDTVIQIDRLTKLYHIGRKEDSYRTLRDVFSTTLISPLKWLTDKFSASQTNIKSKNESIYALKDVSFDVKKGDVVGIIGRNGAGKSTLIKILSRITEPTSGYAEIRGLVGSLLEVGTGFHPELTGRENIYLNGAILGMTKKEIERKFDEIVAFSELEKFLDTPVKHYSSGMYVRLAFAVAAHLEQSILLVDEVLAVGDAAFQKKVLGKMDEIAKENRTILLVSHNMSVILSICQKAIWLNQGEVYLQGDVKDVVNAYMKSIIAESFSDLNSRTDRSGDGTVRLVSLSIDNGTDAGRISSSNSLRIRIGYQSQQKLVHPVFRVGIYDQFGRAIFFLDSESAGWSPDTLPLSGTVICNTGPINLTPGSCMVNLAIFISGSLCDHIISAGTFEVVEDDFFGTGRQIHRDNAIALLHQKWQSESNS